MSCPVDCGDWEDPPENETGQCVPRRLKNSCDAPIAYLNDTAQTVTIPCPDGTVGEEVSFTVEVGAVNNPFSVAAANAAALAQAQAAAEALRAASPCLYPNAEQQCTESCPDGAIGDPITVTIPAGEFTAATLEEANALALAEACAQAAALRTAEPCLYPNEEQECTEECPEGLIGDPITVTVPAGTYFAETLAEANALALAAACAEAATLREATPCEEPEDEEVGSLWGMGWNFYRNLGTGDNSDKLMPAIVGESSPELVWVHVDGNETHTVGRKDNGTLWSWGGNYEGELGHGTRSIFPSVAYDEYFPRQIGSDTDWAGHACGDEWNIAFKEDGTVYTWGYNGFGQLGLNDTTRRLVPTQVPGITNCVAVAAGQYTAYVIKSDGTLWACGRGNVGQLGNGGSGLIDEFAQVGTETDWAAIDSNSSTTIAIKTNGAVYGCGSWNTAIVPNLAAMTLISSGPFESVSAGELFAVAKKSDGTLWSIGLNSSGQLGIGSLTNSNVFVQVGSQTNWVKAVCGDFHTVALNSDGEMWGWGADFFGMLGQASIANDRQSPVQIGPDSLWTNVFTGAGPEGFSFGLRSTTDAPPPPAGISGVALGGNVTIDGGYHIHRFDYDSTFTVVDGLGVNFEVLLVGGGGGGGGLGGGGAGQFSKAVGVTLANGDYPVVVGARGLGQGGGNDGQDGGSSSFNGTTVLGGGGGGSLNDDGSQVGRNGAAGGGGGVEINVAGAAGGTGSTEGNGGNGAHTGASFPNPGGTSGGGGGGSGTNGFNATSSATTGVGGAGGDGTTDSITGTGVVYAAGGGGGGSTSAGNGGSSDTGGKGGVGSSATEGTDGQTPGSGGGGGAGFASDPGNGARGVVIIRYLSPP
jgi:alpha-tubulin suppressor-like RCC1 family protein